MDTTQINTALRRLFDEQQHRIVFWHDPEGEFEHVVEQLDLDAVQVLHLDQHTGLEVKLQIERDDPHGRYLLYAPAEEPDFEHDWLLDVRQYSPSFRADRAAIIHDQLGLAHQHLRNHLAARRKFFDNKERMRKLQQLAQPQDREAELDLKMLTVIVRADQPELFSILRTLFDEMAAEDGQGLNTVPAAWDQVEKFDLAEPFWQMVKSTFGYEEDSPSLRNLLIRMMVTDFATHLAGDLPESLRSLLLKPSGRSNAAVCLGQWRDSASRGDSYDLLAGWVADTLRLPEHLEGLELDALLNVMTFLEVEKAIIRTLRDRLQAELETVDADEVRSIATRRKAGHWAASSGPVKSEVPRQALGAVYDALVAAADFFELRTRHRTALLAEDTAEAAWQAYGSRLFRFDQLYRHFCEAADRAESAGMDVLKGLRDQLEAAYGNWYLKQLGLAWSRFIEPEAGGQTGLLEQWRIEDVPNQRRFYERHVRPWLEEADNRRAYVVISDALRYEAAEELTRLLNGRYRLEAALGSQLGVLPSYTALGMASLLPHRSLGYTEGGDVQVDGQSTASLADRAEVLAPWRGTVIGADTLMGMKKEDGRNYVSRTRVVYIYHNVIDATGDAAATEGDTFDAVRKAIEQLGDLVGYIINTLNGNHVLITADHGFLFSHTPPDDPDRSRLEEKPVGTVKAKKRYLLGFDLPEVEGVWRGETARTAGAEGGMQFLIPRGTNRFHFTGGARFIHGGAMPQEIIVPVVTVRHRKDKGSRGRTMSRPVTVHVLGSNHKITTPRHRFELIQMEPVGERVRPVTLKVGVHEGAEPVTSEETVTFDSDSPNMDDRRRTVSLVLRDRPYDKRQSYRLVLRDAETGVEVQSVAVTIDRAFADDF